MSYYGLLCHETGQLTDISSTVPEDREGARVIELDAMPGYPPGTLLTYDAANRAAIPHVELITRRERERFEQLAREARPEWRAMAEVEVHVVRQGMLVEPVFPDAILSGVLIWPLA